MKIGTFGKLDVTSLGRVDLLAMKVHAGRERDILDVYAQIDSITTEDLAFIRAYLESLGKPWRKHIKPDQIQKALSVLAALEKEMRR